MKNKLVIKSKSASAQSPASKVSGTRNIKTKVSLPARKSDSFAMASPRSGSGITTKGGK